MEETYRLHRSRNGALLTNLWYAGQILMLAVHFVPERVSDGLTGTIGMSWLDLKLGLRLLVKHPGLNLVGGAALAVTIAFGAGLYEFFGEFIAIELPFPEGDRIVRVTNWDTESSAGEPRSEADFSVWREEVSSIDPLAAALLVEANVVGTGGVPIPLAGARTTATLFDVVRVPPLLGRPLLASDQVEGAAPVVVVSHDVWQHRLGALPLSGLSLQIGGIEHEVVGVMPEGFRFPIDHRWWTPLRIPATGLTPRAGNPLLIFGRLASGASLRSAQSELAVLGRRSVERWPETHTRLEPRVTGFWQSPGSGLQRWAALGFQTAFGFLLALAAVNVAILSFSRTASRQGEIAVRTALGAGRRRIVSQLFIEALVLSGVAALVALTVTWLVVPKASELFWRAQGIDVPYWVQPGLSVETAGYALLLAILGASIAGVLPALKVTGKHVAEGLRGISLGGSALRFGLLPTAVIVVQVALAVAFLPYPAAQALALARRQPVANALDGHRILTARLQPDVEASVEDGNISEEEVQRFAGRLEELGDRLVAHPEVLAVTFADRVPGQAHRYREIHVEGSENPPDQGMEVRTAAVFPGYVTALDVRLIAGRMFRLADIEENSGSAVAIVNEAFVGRVPGGGNMVGRRFRFVRSDGQETGSWLEVVGVIQDLNVDPGGSGIEGVDPRPVPAAYTPSSLADLERVQVAVRVTGPAAPFGPELRRTAASVDPRMRVDDVVTLDQVARDATTSDRMLIVLASVVALLIAGLAVGGVYTLMSFIVEQRTREIGIRTALGSSMPELLWAIFSKAMVQLTLGVLGGLAMLALFLKTATSSVVYVAVASSIVILATGLLACALPSLRAIRLEPVEALRSD